MQGATGGVALPDDEPGAAKAPQWKCTGTFLDSRTERSTPGSGFWRRGAKAWEVDSCTRRSGPPWGRASAGAGLGFPMGLSMENPVASVRVACTIRKARPFAGVLEIGADGRGTASAKAASGTRSWAADVAGGLTLRPARSARRAKRGRQHRDAASEYLMSVRRSMNRGR